MKITYRSNNSGGYWWLKDEDWKKLEEAGWEVIWGGRYFCFTRFSTFSPPLGKAGLCDKGKNCPGHRKYDSAEEVGEDRYIGALAVEASKEFSSVREGLEEFEKITKQNISDEGCNCCGEPHHFSWEDAEGEHEGGCGGESCLEYLYDTKVPSSLREACDLLSEK